METELFNRQYIISKKELALNGWKQFLFDNYHVYVHPNLDYVHQDGKHLSVAVLGYLFDYRNTEYTNEDIVKGLSESVDVEDFNMISRCERFMAWTKHYVSKLA